LEHQNNYVGKHNEQKNFDILAVSEHFNYFDSLLIFY